MTGQCPAGSDTTKEQNRTSCPPRPAQTLSTLIKTSLWLSKARGAAETTQGRRGKGVGTDVGQIPCGRVGEGAWLLVAGIEPGRSYSTGGQAGAQPSELLALNRTKGVGRPPPHPSRHLAWLWGDPRVSKGEAGFSQAVSARVGLQGIRGAPAYLLGSLVTLVQMGQLHLSVCLRGERGPHGHDGASACAFSLFMVRRALLHRSSPALGSLVCLLCGI